MSLESIFLCQADTKDKVGRNFMQQVVRLLPLDFETAVGLPNEKGSIPEYKLVPGGRLEVGLMASAFLSQLNQTTLRRRENYLMHAACLCCCAYEEGADGRFNPQGRHVITGKLALASIESQEYRRFENCMDGLYGDRYGDFKDWTLEQALVHIAVVSALRTDCRRELFTSPMDGKAREYALSTLRLITVPDLLNLKGSIDD